MPKAQTGYSNKYNSKMYDQIKINAKKSLRLPELLESASAKTHSNKTQYILEAIQDRLSRDGVLIDDLPPLE